MDLVFKALADPTRRTCWTSSTSATARPWVALRGAPSLHGAPVGHPAPGRARGRQPRSARCGGAGRSCTTSTRSPSTSLQARWIAKYEEPRLDALATVKRRAEDGMDRPSYVYVTYIEATPEAVWTALTDADLSAEYWGHRNESTWEVGAEWNHVRADGSGRRRRRRHGRRGRPAPAPGDHLVGPGRREAGDDLDGDLRDPRRSARSCGSPSPTRTWPPTTRRDAADGWPGGAVEPQVVPGDRQPDAGTAPWSGHR